MGKGLEWQKFYRGRFLSDDAVIQMDGDEKRRYLWAVMVFGPGCRGRADEQEWRGWLDYSSDQWQLRRATFARAFTIEGSEWTQEFARKLALEAEELVESLAQRGRAGGTASGASRTKPLLSRSQAAASFGLSRSEAEVNQNEPDLESEVDLESKSKSKHLGDALEKLSDRESQHRAIRQIVGSAARSLSLPSTPKPPRLTQESVASELAGEPDEVQRQVQLMNRYFDSKRVSLSDRLACVHDYLGRSTTVRAAVAYYRVEGDAFASVTMQANIDHARIENDRLKSDERAFLNGTREPE